MQMNGTPIEKEVLEKKLLEIKKAVSVWLVKRRLSDKSFGHFQFCNSAYVPSELNAETGALELWVMLEMPISASERIEAINHIQAYQNIETGLCSDLSWKLRHQNKTEADIRNGDAFFTMTAANALRALDATFTHPIQYLEQLSPALLIERTETFVGAHSPFRIGDYAALINVNVSLGSDHAVEQFKYVCAYLENIQNPKRGLWANTEICAPYTQYVNLAFHLLRNTWHAINKPYPFADKIIDTCLACANDEAAYSWETGYACNDLDLAVMIYSASRWTLHRRDEVIVWAKKRVPMLLAIQKKDGGFSFFHQQSMIEHAGLKMSPGVNEGDMWGTLMYMGAIKMMVELGYPEIKVPWKYSKVHQVPLGNCVGL